MRRFIMLALSLGVVTAAAAQTQGEIIVRRPGVPDRVIKLDSLAVQEQMEGMRNTTLASRQFALASHQFAIPLLRDLQLATRRRPLLGITVAVQPRETDKVGAYIEAVTPGSPAAKAGILAGDIIVRIAGKAVVDKDPKGDSSPGQHLISIIATLTVGKPVDAELRRGTQTVSVKVTPTEGASSESMARMTPVPSIAGDRLLLTDRFSGEMAAARTAFGMAQQANTLADGGGAFSYSFGNNGLFANIELTSLNEKLGSYFGATEGVLVVNVGAPRVMPFMRSASTTGGRGGAAGRVTRADSVVIVEGKPLEATVTHRAPINIPVEPGDVILSVDGRKVTSPSQLMRIVGSYDHNDEFKLQIMRQKRAETLTIKMP